MPYYKKRKFIKRRKLYKGRLYKRRKFLRKRALVSKKPETKFYDSSVSNTNIDYASPQFVLLNDLVQGTTDSDVIGRNYVIKSIYIRLALYMNTGTSQCQVRCMLVQDKECNGSAVTGSLLWTSGVGNLSYLSPINQLYVNRFKIHWDKLYTFSNTGMNNISIKKYIKSFVKVNINGLNTQTISDIQHNSLYLVFTCDRTSTLLPNYTLFYRLRYLDV